MVTTQLSTPWNFRCWCFSWLGWEKRIGKTDGENNMWHLRRSGRGENVKIVRSSLVDSAGVKRWHLGNTTLCLVLKFPRHFPSILHPGSKSSIQNIASTQVSPYEGNLQNCVKKIRQQNSQKPGSHTQLLPASPPTPNRSTHLLSDSDILLLPKYLWISLLSVPAMPALR